MRLAIIGTGRMGQVVSALAPERGFTVAAQTGRPGADFWDTLAVDVIIDFSHAAQVPAIVKAALRRQIPLITGTTGWQAELPHLLAEAERHPTARWLRGGNFSRGIALLKLALQALNVPWAHFTDWEALLIETHHRHKKDAPSGTAIELAEAFPAVRHTHSLRVGEVIGEHRLLLSGPGEEIELIHRAHDRRVFAEGALWAARWLLQQERFVGSFEEALRSGLDQKPA